MEKTDYKCEKVSRQFEKFGTEIDFQIVVESQAQFLQAQKDLALAEEKCTEIEKIFSRFDQASELSKINTNLGVEFSVSPLFLEVAQLVLESYEKTNGYFDPRIIAELENTGYGQDFEKISSVEISQNKKVVDFEKSLSEDLKIENDKIIFQVRMDFTGIVKGFAVDHVAEFLTKRDWQNFVVDCGGDMFFAGKDKENKPWYIDVEGIPAQNLLLELQNCAIATSGIGKRKWEIAGQRFHHLINPKKIGQYSFDLKAVTVVAGQAWQADVWAKTIFVMGNERARQFTQANQLACALLDYRGGVWLSTEFKKYLYKKDEEKK
ncbi:MAG: FAD:protein FMN transferase [Candidatus Moraniibacteriota bacterium]